MAFDILQSVKDIFDNELIGKAASTFGEGESNMSKAVAGLIPSVLGTVVSKGTSDTDSAGSLLNMAKSAAGSGILGELGSRFTNLSSGSFNSGGTDMARRLLGDKVGNISSAISSYAGIKDSSMSSLLSMVVPATLGVLGRHAAENNLSSSGLSNLLATQRSSIASALPAGLSSLTGLLGLGGAAEAFKGAATSHEAQDRKGTGVNWTWPIVLLIVIIGLVYLLSRSCNKEATPVAAAGDTSAMAARPAAVMHESIKVRLPDGTELDAYTGGIEDQLVTFLNAKDLSDSVSNNRWFDFDNLSFKTGSAELTDSSMKQVNNLVAILKAYPKVSLKIGGYTDKTGDESVNMKLSQERADAVAGALKNAGAASTQLAGAEGYGSQFAKAAAEAPDQERRADRRISVSVRSK